MPAPRKKSDFVTSRLRLRDADYAAPGAYFITIVTNDRAPLFGACSQSGMVLSPAGVLMQSLWTSIADRWPPIQVDAFVVMPNHLHGILIIPSSLEETRNPSIIDALHWFKTRSVVEYGAGVKELGWPWYRGRLWQTGFIDRILRDDRELEQKRAYIEANPYRWDEDELHRG